MGWKSFKNHFSIEHIVCRTGENFAIGSAYISRAVVVAPDGRVLEDCGNLGSSAFTGYVAQIQADPERVRDLLAQEDTFEVSLPVYTFQGGDIVQHWCEEYGWPNVTHDGQLMYDNQFFRTREAALKKARLENKLHIQNLEEFIARREQELDNLRAELETARQARTKLKGQVPTE